MFSQMWPLFELHVHRDILAGAVTMQLMLASVVYARITSGNTLDSLFDDFENVDPPQESPEKQL